MNTDSANILTKNTAGNPIYDITPFTLLDYPGKTACIIWFAGCNMRCSYCYNPSIVLGKGSISYFDALKFVISRGTLLDAVVLSGGECTSHKDIQLFAESLKKLGRLVKVDTNGSNPEVLKGLIAGQLADFVALDFKAPRARWEELTASKHFEHFEQSLGLLISSGVPFEVRTTVHDGLLTTEDLSGMITYLEEKNYRGTYYLQEFRNATSTIGSLPPSGRLTKDGLKSKSFAIEIRA